MVGDLGAHGNQWVSGQVHGVQVGRVQVKVCSGDAVVREKQRLKRHLLAKQVAGKRSQPIGREIQVQKTLKAVESRARYVRESVVLKEQVE